MNYTPNYSMKLPGYGDNADIADLNENTTTIDDLIHDNRTMIAQAYSQLESYVVGDIVENEGKLYRCIGATSGNWDSTKWTRTTLGDEVEESGASALADLDDVSLTTPTEGQILTYDGDEWVNADAPDVDVTKTASGNPIEVSDSASAPLVKCMSAIQGSQDLHGYDKPWVGGAGKNIWDEEWELGGFETDGSPNARRDVIRSKNYIPCLPSTSYFFVQGTLALNEWSYWVFYDSSKNIIGGRESARGEVTTPSTAAYMKFQCQPNYGVTYNNDCAVNYPSTVTTYSPYSNICPITAYTEGKIEVVGHNLWDEVWEVGSINKDTGQNTSGLSDGIRSKNYIRVQPSTEYHIIQSGENSGNLVVYFYAKDKSFVIYTGQSAYQNGYNGVLGKFTTPSNVEFVRFRTAGTYGQTYNNDIALNYPSNVDDYSPYTSTTHTTTYPSAIYRGSEDVVNGTETHDIEVYEFTGNETIEQASTNPYVFNVNAPYKFDLGTGSSQDIARPWSHFKGVSYKGAANMADGEARQYRSGIYWVFSFCNHNLSSVSDCATWLANQAQNGTPVQIAAPLATPTTEPVTTTNLPVKSLSGYSHIESSTGEMEIEYIAKAFSPITEIVDSQISALQKMMELMLTSAREATMTASANYTTGTLIVACGALYKATTAISSGASLVVGTNITPTTIAAELAALA